MKSRIIIQPDVSKPDRTVLDVRGYLFGIDVAPFNVSGGMSTQFCDEQAESTAQMLAAAIMRVHNSNAGLAGMVCARYLTGELATLMEDAGSFVVGEPKPPAGGQP